MLDPRSHFTIGRWDAAKKAFVAIGDVYRGPDGTIYMTNMLGLAPFEHAMLEAHFAKRQSGTTGGNEIGPSGNEIQVTRWVDTEVGSLDEFLFAVHRLPMPFGVVHDPEPWKRAKSSP